MTTDNTRALLEQAYEEGWKTAALWVSRDDLIADIDSRAYLDDRDVSLAELSKPTIPAWHDAPTCAGLWVRSRHEGIGVYSISEPPIKFLKGSAARWYGPIQPDGEKS